MYFNFAFFEPVAASYLQHSLGLSEVYIGVYFALFPICYTIGSLTYQFVPSQIARRHVIMAGTLFYAIANIFSGPSLVLGLPLSLTLMFIGQLMLGYCGALMIVPSMPEMIDSLKYMYPGQENEVGLQSAGIFNSALATGQILGPIYATSSVQAVGFRYSCDVQAIAYFIFFVLYVIYTWGSSQKL